MTEEKLDRAYLTEDEVDYLGELTDTELREGETADPSVAAEEGMTWVPPIDPPVVADIEDPEGARVAAGFSVDALDERYDADHHSELVTVDDELGARIREALLADSSTSRFADSLIIGTRGGSVVVRGAVDDLVDTDNAAAVISNVAGVEEVVDELDVPGVTR